MKVVATAPMPGSRIPSLPAAGFTSTPFFRAIGAEPISARPRDRGRNREFVPSEDLESAVLHVSHAQGEDGGLERELGADVDVARRGVERHPGAGGEQVPDA